MRMTQIPHTSGLIPRLVSLLWEPCGKGGVSVTGTQAFQHRPTFRDLLCQKKVAENAKKSELETEKYGTRFFS